MKTGKTILKIITVTSSATLMVGFVAFEAGAFHEYLGFRTHTTPPDSLKKDSTKTEELDLNDFHFHSSKSMMPDIPETLIFESALDTIDLDLIEDTTKKHPFESDPGKDTTKKTTEGFRHMGSTKSIRSHYVTEELTKTDTLKRVEQDSISPNQPDPKVEKKKNRKNKK